MQQPLQPQQQPQPPMKGIDLYMEAAGRPQSPARPKPQEVLQRVAHVVSEGAAIVDNMFSKARSI